MQFNLGPARHQLFICSPQNRIAANWHLRKMGEWNAKWFKAFRRRFVGLPATIVSWWRAHLCDSADLIDYGLATRRNAFSVRIAELVRDGVFRYFRYLEVATIRFRIRRSRISSISNVAGLDPDFDSLIVVFQMDFSDHELDIGQSDCLGFWISNCQPEPEVFGFQNLGTRPSLILVTEYIFRRFYRRVVQLLILR